MISASAPDGEGYVTYTVTCTVTSKCHLGTTKAEPEATPYSIWFKTYELYDYYTGRAYFIPYMDTAKTGQASDSATTSVEHGGKTFTVSCQATSQSIASAGSDWVESEQPEFTYEIHSDLVYRITMTVRAPGDYDGLMLGLDTVGQPSSVKEEQVDLTSVNVDGYRFTRLN